MTEGDPAARVYPTDVRILVCSQEAPLPPTNGLRLQVDALLGELRQRHDVRVIGFRMPDQTEEVRSGDGLRLVPLPIGNAVQKARSLATAVPRRRPHGVDSMAGHLRRALQEELLTFRPDVVHVTMGRLAALGREVRGRPSVLAALDAWYLIRQAQVDASSGPRRALLRREVARVRHFEATEYRRFQRVVVVSEQDGSALRALDPSLHVEVIPNGVDMDAFAPMPDVPVDRDRIVFHGLMHFAPNVSAAEFVARRVLPRVRAVRPDAHLVLVGRGPTAAVRALEDLPGVQVTGEVPDVRPWITGSRVYACPMVSGTGIKNKLLEAMACGVPCVATPLALQGISAEPGRDVLVAADEERFAAELVRVLEDDELASDLSRAGREAVRTNHSWAAVGHAYEEVYLEAIEEVARVRSRLAPARVVAQGPSTSVSRPVPEALSGAVVDDLEELRRWEPEWDALAVATDRPYCAPGWMLAWWRHVAPPGAKLRVVLAVEGGRLLGIAPLFVDRGHGGLSRYRLLASGTSMPIEPLARPGCERLAAQVFAAQLASASPPVQVLVLEGIPSTSPWPGLLARAWPGTDQPWVHIDYSRRAPTLALSDRSFPEWMASRGRHFRKHMGRDRRQLESRGGAFRLAATPDEVEAGLRSFGPLHHARWDRRGGSNVLTPQVEAMLVDAGRRMVEDGRFRLWNIEVDGRTISSHVFLNAGGELAYWLGAFDESWSELGPSMQAILAAVEHAWTKGDRRVDFGPGGQPYKYRFADGEDVLNWVTLVPQTLGYRRARVQLLPKHAYRAISSRLPPRAKDLLGTVIKRSPRWAR
jgi:polysaccharide biosynthesis protein PslH